jgi:hypothetical protein
MNILKKIFVPNGQTQELEAFESWTVRWISRHGTTHYDTQKEAEVFTNEKDAEKFATELKNAFKLLRHTSGTNVRISKN